MAVKAGGRSISQIKGWGDTKKDCTDYLQKHPELKKAGYRAVKLGNTWVVAK